MTRNFVFALLSSACTAVSALPMGSVDTWMVMGDFAADSREVAANYALTPRDAIGVAAGRWRSKPEAGDAQREFAGLTYTRLLRRWNLPHAQANLWFVLNSGGLRDRTQRSTSSMISPAVMADYETTRVYAGAGLKTMRASAVRHETAYLRAGFSLYETDYEEVQPWLMAETARERDGVATNKSAAWLRFIHKRYFVEVGADENGRARFSFMLNHW